MSEEKEKIKKIIQDDITQLELDIEKVENQQTEEVELKYMELGQLRSVLHRFKILLIEIDRL